MSRQRNAKLRESPVKAALMDVEGRGFNLAVMRPENVVDQTVRQAAVRGWFRVKHSPRSCKSSSTRVVRLRPCEADQSAGARLAPSEVDQSAGARLGVLVDIFLAGRLHHPKP
jgi:hypothetical protein